MCASHWAFTKPKGEMKVKVASRSLRCDPVSFPEARAQHRPVLSALSVRRRLSVHVRTRKMVNYA